MKNKYFIKLKSIYLIKEDGGFAISQILVLGIGLAAITSGIIAATINGLTESKISRQELMAKAASESGVTTYRALLNDNGDSLFYYYWLTKNCSTNASECPTNIPKGTISNPSMLFWQDKEFCNGDLNCKGRRVAPICNYERKIGWNRSTSYFRTLLDGNPDIVGYNLAGFQKDYNQFYDLKSTEFTGSEDYGITSILIEGINKSISPNEITASNKLRVNFQVHKNIPLSGFAFLSVGENIEDNQESLFLGNLNTYGDKGSTAKGSIIWRRNLNENFSNCGNLEQEAKAINSNLPKKGNGGIWAQPLKMPKEPSLGGIKDIGILICTPEVSNRRGSSCKLNDYLVKKPRNYLIHNIFASSIGSKFEVSTSDDSIVNLKILGDIDISNGGVFCHRDKSSPCGSGNPNNLNIFFSPLKANTATKYNKLVCNMDGDGGVKLKNKRAIVSLGPSELPANSFNIDNTDNDIFKAFIYAPKNTLISLKPENNWVQEVNRSTSRNISSPMIITTRGVKGWIEETKGGRWDEKMTNVFVLGNRLITSENSNFDIIAIGNNNNHPDSQRRNGILVYNNSNRYYYFYYFNKQQVNQALDSSSQLSLPLRKGIINNTQPINLGSYSSLWAWIRSSSLFRDYNINLRLRPPITQRNFSGAAWVKNLCLDNRGTKRWYFSEKFYDEFNRPPKEKMKFGVGYYRGQSILLWDTLRDFRS